MGEQPAILWKSLKWKDGTEYEGLVNNGRMHSHGVLKFPSKDRYEGQFENGVMDGYGVYVWADGTIYRGDWVQGRMHGCGVKIWRRPDGGIGSQEGKFLGDDFVGPIMPCGKDGAFEAAVEADMASYQARSFQLSRQRPPPAAAGAAAGPSWRQQQRQQQPTAAAAAVAVAARPGGGAAGAGPGPGLPPEAQERVGVLLDRLMGADAPRAPGAQARALGGRQ